MQVTAGDAVARYVQNPAAYGQKTPTNSRRRETRDLRLTRVSHLSRLISSPCTGHWLIFGAEHFLPAPPMAHRARCPQRHGQSASAADHRVPQNTQIEVLPKKLGKKRLLLDDNQRRLLAVKAHAIGHKALLELTTIVTPDTILRWHRKLVAKKFDSSDKRRPGRPRIRQEIVDTIVRFTKQNPAWGLRSHSGIAEEHRLPRLRCHRRQRAEGSWH
jgi:hypothetical protein